MRSSRIVARFLEGFAGSSHPFLSYSTRAFFCLSPAVLEPIRPLPDVGGELLVENHPAASAVRTTERKARPRGLAIDGLIIAKGEHAFFRRENL